MHLQNKKILIVDDTEEICWIFERIFSEEGYKVLSAPNGKQALSIVKKHNPNLIFLDFILPDLDGVEILNKIRSFDSNTPVIIVSSDIQVKKIQQASKQKNVSVLSKPFRFDELMLKVENAFATS